MSSSSDSDSDSDSDAPAEIGSPKATRQAMATMKRFHAPPTQADISARRDTIFFVVQFGNMVVNDASRQIEVACSVHLPMSWLLSQLIRVSVDADSLDGAPALNIIALRHRDRPEILRLEIDIGHTVQRNDTLVAITTERPNEVRTPALRERLCAYCALSRPK